MSSTPGPASPSEEQRHLLLVDDDARLRSVIRRYLQRNGFHVTEAADTVEARNQLALFEFDLIILDVMMPGESGMDFLKELRRDRLVPVLMLTAMAEGSDRILGLERGADDYLGKPFEPRELVLRLRLILARNTTATPNEADGKELILGGCKLDLVRGELRHGGDIVHLTESESCLLMALAAKPGEAVPREKLSAASQFAGSERAVDVHITRLRRKIEQDPKFPRYLQTVRGMGYVLKPD